MFDGSPKSKNCLEAVEREDEDKGRGGSISVARTENSAGFRCVMQSCVVTCGSRQFVVNTTLLSLPCGID